jgi:hypothetical protein
MALHAQFLQLRIGLNGLRQRQVALRRQWRVRIDPQRGLVDCLRGADNIDSGRPVMPGAPRRR